MYRNCPNVDEKEQKEVKDLVHRKQENKYVIRNRLNVTVKIVESM